MDRQSEKGGVTRTDGRGDQVLVWWLAMTKRVSFFLRSSFANEECLRSYNEKREVLELCSQGIAGNLMKWLINTYK